MNQDKLRGVIYVIAGWATDLFVFYSLVDRGIPWTTAHLISFLVVAIVMHALRACPPRHPAGAMRQIFALLTVQLMVVSLRGGTLALLIDTAQFSPTLAMIPVSALTLAATIWGVNLWLDPSGKSGDGKKGWDHRTILTLAIYALALRIIYSFSFDLIHEEAYYWNYAQHLSIGYLDHPPMVGWLIWLFSTLLGPTEFAVRLGSLSCWLATMGFMYHLAKDLFGTAAALRTLLLVAILPAYFGTGLVMTPDAPLIACWAAALFFLNRSIVLGHRWAWLGVGLSMGLGMLSKYSIGLLGMSSLIFMIVDTKSRKWFIRPEPYLAGLLAIALFSPVIIWNASHDWVSFGFQTVNRLSSNYKFAFHELLGSVMALITPTGFLAAFLLIVSRKSVLPPLATEQKLRSYRILAMSVLLPFGVFCLFSFFRAVKFNWTAPIWLGILPYCAVMIRPPSDLLGPEGSSLLERLSRYARAAWPATIVSVLALYGILLYHQVIGLPVVSHGPGAKISLSTAIPDLARQIGAAQDQYERQHGERPLIICDDTDTLAGWIAFYRSKQAMGNRSPHRTEFVSDITGGELLKRDSRMYRLWFPLENLTEGQCVMVICKQHKDLTSNRVTRRLDPIGEIVEVTPLKRGRPAKTYFYQFARIRRIR